MWTRKFVSQMILISVMKSKSLPIQKIRFMYSLQLIQNNIDSNLSTNQIKTKGKLKRKSRKD